MYKNVKIYFKKNNNELFNQQNIIDVEFISFLLYRIGNIEQDRIIESANNQCILSTITSDMNKLEKRINKLNKTFSDKFNIELVEGNYIATTPKICKCKDHAYYIIDPRYDFITNKSTSSIIKCGNCKKDIPISIFDNLTSDDKSDIIKLQECYNSIETLRLYEFEEEKNINLLEKYNSEFNQLAQKIVNNLEKKTKKKVYYFLKNPVDGLYKENRKNLEHCPNCNSKLMPHTKESNICHNCKLILPIY